MYLHLKKAHARSVFRGFGRKAITKNFLQNFFRHARAVIDKMDRHPIWILRIPFHRDMKELVFPAFHRIISVDEKLEKNFLQSYSFKSGESQIKRTAGRLEVVELCGVYEEGGEGRIS